MHMTNIPAGDSTRRFDSTESRVTRFGQYFFTACTPTSPTACVFVPWNGGPPQRVLLDLSLTNQGQARYDAVLAHHKTLLLAAGGRRMSTPQPQAQTWDTAQLTADFEVKGFAMGVVVVKRRADGVVGTLEFTHRPRLYFNFQEDRP